MRRKHEVSVFKVFGGGHFNSRVFKLGVTRNCYRLLEAKDFSKNPGQFKSVIKETRYQVSIAELFTRDLKSQIEVLVGRPNTYHLLYFSGDHEFLQNSPGKKSLYHRGGKVIPLKPIEK